MRAGEGDSNGGTFIGKVLSTHDKNWWDTFLPIAMSKANPLLRFIYTRNLGIGILPSDAISIEILPSFQIAIAGNSDNM